MASKVTGLSIICSTLCTDADERKYKRSVSLAFVMGIHRCPVDSPHKQPLTRKMLPFDNGTMEIVEDFRCHHWRSNWHHDNFGFRFNSFSRCRANVYNDKYTWSFYLDMLSPAQWNCKWRARIYKQGHYALWSWSWLQIKSYIYIYIYFGVYDGYDFGFCSFPLTSLRDLNII